MGVLKDLLDSGAWGTAASCVPDWPLGPQDGDTAGSTQRSCLSAHLKWAETKLSSLRAERQQYGRGARANLAAEIAEWEQYVADEHEAQAQQPGPSRSNWNGAGPSNGAASGDRNPPRHRSGGDSEDARRRENHSLIQIQTYSSFLLCPSSVLFIFTLHLCVCLPALLTCSGALRTRPSAGRGTRLVRTGTALASAAIARPDQRRRLRWRLQRHLSPSGRWIF